MARKEGIKMGAFIAKQPNGRYCRFSTVTDCITHYNMTEEEYIEMRAESAREHARDVLKNHLRPFEEVKEKFSPNNMTKEAFDNILSLMLKERMEV